MNPATQFRNAATCVAFLFFTIGCGQTANEAENKQTASEETLTADPAKLKTEIQEQETAWAEADNRRDVNALAAFYSDDAVSMSDGKPMMVGNAAIKKDMEESIAKRPKGTTISYDVIDVFGSGDYVTETGKTTRKDSTGNVVSTGKYMAVWEKQNGKWICIRDISNEDEMKQ